MSAKKDHITMKVRFLANACACGFGYANGATADLPDATAKDAISKGCAVVVEGLAPETNESPEGENRKADKSKVKTR